MAIINDFEYFRPTDIAEAVRLLNRFDKTEVLAGGTDLVNSLKECLTAPQAVVDIKALPGLRGIELHAGKLTVGALVTFTELTESPVVRETFPLIGEVARTVGSVGVRNRATMAGNICSSVPCMDSGPMLSVYDAEVIVEGPEGTRAIPIAEFFIRPRQTAIRKGELLTHIVIPQPVGTHAGCYVKLGRYRGEDLAQASVCILALANHQYRVAFGAVGPVPIRSRRIEQMLANHAVSDALIAKVQNVISEEVTPITDVRATREYRMHMCKVMFERGLKAAAARLAGDGPPYGTHLI